MAKKVKFGWLKNKKGEYFAPKTMIEQVMSESGKTLKSILGMHEDSLKKAENDLKKKITSPSVAKEGQQLVVKTVNPDGSPSEWGCSDVQKQVQADYAQTDSEKPDYIKNKPTNLATKDDLNNYVKKTNQYLNTWTDEPPFLDTVSGGYKVTFPTTLHIYYNGTRFTVSAKSFTFSCTSTQYLHHLLVKPNTSTVSTCPHGNTIPDGYISIGLIHVKRGVFLTGQGAKQTKELTPAALIIGCNAGEKYVEFDSVKKTVTFPDDTVVLFNNDSLSTFYTLANSKNNTKVSWSSLSTSAINVFLNRKTKLLECKRYDAVVDGRYILLASIRTYNGAVAISVPYRWDGKLFNFISQSDLDAIHNSGGEGGAVVNETSLVKAVNHRGYSTEAPENTLSAYKLSADKGYKYVECDVSFTSDGVAVLLHDATVDRTSDGTGNINNLTLEQVRAMDFGSWKSSAYAGEQIPTFTEFLALCKNLGLHPYIELKSSATYTSDQIAGLVRTVKQYGMIKDCTWISFNSTLLEYVKTADPEARLGFVCNALSNENINTAYALKNDTNEVFVDVNYANASSTIFANTCMDSGVGLEVWTLNDSSALVNLISNNPYISGVTSDNVHAGRELYSAYMNK